MSEQCKSRCPECDGFNNFDYEGSDIFNTTAFHTNCIKCGHRGYFKDGIYQMTPIERHVQHIAGLESKIQRMEDNKLKLIGNLQQAVEALLEIADYADKEPFDMRDLKLIAIASDCLGVG